ncbi:MAG: Asp-tRNA(Asn)/Glu-tRNA(Gln) amidotransferase subunit GatC [Chloroflexi bacterium]|nr:Asp-tRNA(Asn)/Glu-tRNA(Gln) amidotransferase subunit GatC [Chloroflexota bacterium]
MPQCLSRQQVLHIAELAKLALSEDEIALFGEQLGEILAYADRLNSLDTSAIAPTAQAIAMRNVTREDAVRPSLAPEQALANAPDREGEMFRIKPVFD